jgi:transcriptional regulator with XRE-family HTH domain
MLRLSAGLSQKDLAEKTGLQIRYLSSLENKPQDISTRTLEKLALGLGVSAATIIDLGDDRPAQALALGLDEAIRVLRLHRAKIRT